MKGKVENIYLSETIVGTAFIDNDDCCLEFIDDKTGNKYLPTPCELAVITDIVWDLADKRWEERDADDPFVIDASTEKA